MRTEPPPCRWVFPPVEGASDDGVLALGADLEPGTLLQAYRSGVFPMPVGREHDLAWFSPDPRGIVPLGDFRPSRSLRRSARRFGASARRGASARALDVVGRRGAVRPTGSGR